MRKVFRYIAAMILFALPIVATSTPVFAADVFQDVCSYSDKTGNSESTTCNSLTPGSSTNPLTGTNGTLYKVSIIIAVMAGLVAVIVIMVSGFRYVTSGGDTQKTASARSTLVGAIVGLVIIVLAQSIITIIVRSLQ